MTARRGRGGGEEGRPSHGRLEISRGDLPTRSRHRASAFNRSEPRPPRGARVPPYPAGDARCPRGAPGTPAARCALTTLPARPRGHPTRSRSKKFVGSRRGGAARGETLSPGPGAGGASPSAATPTCGSETAAAASPASRAAAALSFHFASLPVPLPLCPRLHGHHTNVGRPCVVASDLAGVTLKTEPEMRSGLVGETVWVCM